MLKPEIMHQKMGKRYESQSRLLAERFGVSPKTVRDIWNRKTWVSATMHLFGLTLEEVKFLETSCDHSFMFADIGLQHPFKTDKPRGRPRGPSSRCPRKASLMQNQRLLGLEFESGKSASSDPSPSSKSQPISPAFTTQVEVPQDPFSEFDPSTLLSGAQCRLSNRPNPPLYLELSFAEEARLDEPWPPTCEIGCDDPFHLDWPHWRDPECCQSATQV